MPFPPISAIASVEETSFPPFNLIILLRLAKDESTAVFAPLVIDAKSSVNEIYDDHHVDMTHDIGQAVRPYPIQVMASSGRADGGRVWKQNYLD